MLAVQALERSVLEAEGLEGLVLRYGYFYGPGTGYASDGSVTADVRRRRFPVVGDGAAVWSFVHVDDAAQATRLAVESNVTGRLNIVDDDPAPVAEWLPVFAAAAGAPGPAARPGGPRAGCSVGSYAVAVMTRVGGADPAGRTPSSAGGRGTRAGGRASASPTPRRSPRPAADRGRYLASSQFSPTPMSTASGGS